MCAGGGGCGGGGGVGDVGGVVGVVVGGGGGDCGVVSSCAKSIGTHTRWQAASHCPFDFDLFRRRRETGLSTFQVNIDIPFATCQVPWLMDHNISIVWRCMFIYNNPYVFVRCW